MESVDNNECFIILIGQDVTDLEKSNQQVKFFDQLIKDLPGVVYWKDINSVHLGCNKGFAKQAGLQSPEDVIGKTDYDLPWKDQAAVFKTEDQYVIQTGNPKINFENSCINSKGERVTALTNKAPLRDIHGKVVGVIGNAFDISQEKMYANKIADFTRKIKDILGNDSMINNLGEEEKHFVNFLDAIIAHMPGNVYWKNVHSIYMGCNHNVVHACGLLSRQEIIGITDEFLEKKLNWKRGTAERFKQDDQKVINNKSSITFEDIFVQSNGQEVVMLTTKTPIFNDQREVIGILAVSLDITEQKKQAAALKIEKEKAERASQAKSEFIANMSHDIRTPIAGIAGMIQGLLKLAAYAQQQLHNDQSLTQTEQQKLVSTMGQYSHVLMNSTDELLQLCNEILETVSLESGQAALTPQSFDIRELALHTQELLEPVAHDRKLALSVEVDEAVPRFLKGLRPFLDRTLLNLTSNALKFTEQGFVKIKFSLEHTGSLTPNLVLLKVVVADSGIGIPADKFEVIFDHFSRLNPSYKGVYKGSGLGLYTVKQYVHAMKGTITVASQLGSGTEFTVLLPFEVSDHSDYVRQSIRTPQPKQSIDYTSLRSASNIEKAQPSPVPLKQILVVEDNTTAAMAIQIALSSYDCKVDLAVTGQEALEKAQQQAYDLILMDIGLPDTDGLEVTKKIRAMDHSIYSEVPIVALTGHLNHRDACLEAGMQDLLTKPAQPSTLDLILQRYVFQNETSASAHTGTPAQSISKTSEESIIAAEVQQKTAALPIIEWEESLYMVGGIEPVLLNLLHLCTKELKQTQTILAASYPQKDVAALRAELHRCLGGICYLKLPQLDYSLKAFQKAIKREPQHLKEVENTYAAVQTAIQAFLTTIARGN